MSILNLWKEKGKIIEGLRNYIFKREDVEDVARERFAICVLCKSYDDKGKECIVPGTGPCCKECGCCLQLKTRSMSSECPFGKWKALMSEEEEEILNEQL